MAQYEITRACGHIETIQIYGSNARGQHDWQSRTAAEVNCAVCRQADRDAVNARAAQVADAAGLPVLTGSPKQVAWAATIRLDALAAVEEYARKQVRGGDDATRARVAAVLAQVITRILTGHTDARWWIDNRTGPGGEARYEMTDADEAAVRAAEVPPQDPAEDTPQAAIGTLRGRGWTVAKIAAECGVHRTTVYRWATGTHAPNTRNAAALALLAR